MKVELLEKELCKFISKHYISHENEFKRLLNELTSQKVIEELEELVKLSIDTQGQNLTDDYMVYTEEIQERIKELKQKQDESKN